MPGTHYLFRIAAVNSQGGSCWSYPTLTATRAAPPLPPAAPRVAATSCSAVAISWAAPECQGAQVASYQVEAAVVRAEANGNASSSAAPEAAGGQWGGWTRVLILTLVLSGATQSWAVGTPIGQRPIGQRRGAGGSVGQLQVSTGTGDIAQQAWCRGL